MPADEAPGRDPWTELCRYTSARIALGRRGGSQPTAAVLDFRLAHARARDAVQAPFDPAPIEAEFSRQGIPALRLTTRASNRADYLARPPAGRALAVDSRRRLEKLAAECGRRDLVLIVSDGLSALAAERHAVAAAVPLIGLLKADGWSFFPVCVAPLARVKLQDEVGEILGARHALIFLGERPGLGSPDSLGAYFTYRPRSRCTDADRNCVSNIREGGLRPAEAAVRMAALLQESARRRLSGVALKDQTPASASLVP